VYILLPARSDSRTAEKVFIAPDVANFIKNMLTGCTKNRAEEKMDLTPNRAVEDIHGLHSLINIRIKENEMGSKCSMHESE
jgi:hypothetical protein